MNMWPPLRIDLAPGVPMPRTLQSSCYRTLFDKPARCEPQGEEGSVDRWEWALQSVNHGAAIERYHHLRRAGGSATEAAVTLWIGEEPTDSSPLFVQLNRILLADDEDQLQDWLHFIRLMTDFITRPERAPSSSLTTWRGSKLTRRQVNNLRNGEVIRPPMFVATYTNRHLATVFQDIYLIRLYIPSQCRNAGFVREAPGVSEIILPPYTPMRVTEVGLDEIIKVDVLDNQDYIDDVELPSGSHARCFLI